MMAELEKSPFFRAFGLGALLLVGLAFFGGWWLRGARDAGAGNGAIGSVPTYTEVVGVTSGGDEVFAGFLADNLGQVVFLSSFLDISVSIESQQEIADQFDVHDFTNDASTWLPLAADGSVMLALDLLDGRELPTSHGGTGVVHAECLGYFWISSTVHSGPSMTYRLREIPVVMTATALNQTGAR
ncbi:hypothetical protein N9Z12_06350 [Opitutaceae bacterium]|nr:hypothetical protein [Opitutaceae bacterium]